MNRILLFSTAMLFLISCSKDQKKAIVYPEISSYGKNILYGDTVLQPTGISLAANLPAGTALKIKIKGKQLYDMKQQMYTGGVWWLVVSPSGPINWTYDAFDKKERSQEFWAIENNKKCDFSISFKPGIYSIEYYENHATTPTKVKDFRVNP